MLVSTIIPIYFNFLAGNAGISEVDYLAYWGYAASVATVMVAIIGPILGTLADTRNFKKPLFTISMMVGVLGCAALSFPKSWVLFLAVFVIAKVGYNASMIPCWSISQQKRKWTPFHHTAMHGDTSEAAFHLLYLWFLF